MGRGPGMSRARASRSLAIAIKSGWASFWVSLCGLSVLGGRQAPMGQGGVWLGRRGPGLPSLQAARSGSQPLPTVVSVPPSPHWSLGPKQHFTGSHQAQ